MQLVCVCGPLGMCDVLLMHLYGNLLEVGHRQRGVGRVGRLLLLPYLGDCLTICETCMSYSLSGRVSHCFLCPRVIGLIEWLCETCMSCPLSGRVSHCFSCPHMIGLIEWLCLLAFFWCGEYGFSIVGVGVILPNDFDHFVLSHWYSGAVVSKARWYCSCRESSPRVGV